MCLVKVLIIESETSLNFKHYTLNITNYIHSTEGRNRFECSRFL